MSFIPQFSFLRGFHVYCYRISSTCFDSSWPPLPLPSLSVFFSFFLSFSFLRVFFSPSHNHSFNGAWYQNLCGWGKDAFCCLRFKFIFHSFLFSFAYFSEYCVRSVKVYIKISHLISVQTKSHCTTAKAIPSLEYPYFHVLENGPITARRMFVFRLFECCSNEALRWWNQRRYTDGLMILPLWVSHCFVARNFFFSRAFAVGAAEWFGTIAWKWTGGSKKMHTWSRMPQTHARHPLSSIASFFFCYVSDTFVYFLHVSPAPFVEPTGLCYLEQVGWWVPLMTADPPDFSRNRRHFLSCSVLSFPFLSNVTCSCMAVWALCSTASCPHASFRCRC